MRISFSVPDRNSPWIDTWEAVNRQNAAEVSEMDLRYKYFGVNVEMSADGVDIISGRQFVTLVDLALSFRHVIETVSRGEDASFGFTESDKVVRIRHAGENLLISSSSNSAQVSVRQEELVAQISKFLRSAQEVLIQRVPELGGNPVIQRLSLDPPA